jgi:hypothetical protein
MVNTMANDNVCVWRDELIENKGDEGVDIARR